MDDISVLKAECMHIMDCKWHDTNQIMANLFVNKRMGDISVMKAGMHAHYMNGSKYMNTLLKQD